MIAAIVAFAIILVVVSFVFFVIIRQLLAAPTPDQRHRWTLWLLAGVTVFSTIQPWLFIFTDIVWPLVMMAAMSAVVATALLISVRNWHHWSRPRNPLLRRTVLIVAPLALLSDVVLLILLVAR